MGLCSEVDASLQAFSILNQIVVHLEWIWWL